MKIVFPPEIVAKIRVFLAILIFGMEYTFCNTHLLNINMN